MYKTPELALASIGEWAIGINGLTDKELADGVEKVRKECTWPPTIAEFRKLCKKPKNDWGHIGQSKEYNPELLRIGIVKASEETHKTELEKMRDKLKR